MPDLHLARSLYVQNVPRHACTHACSLCGFEATPTRTRANGYALDRGLDRVGAALERIRSQGAAVDHLTVRADGEPTLDRNLGALLEGLRRFGLPVVVHTNGSTLHRDDVRSELSAADVICLGLSTTDPEAWSRLHRQPSDRLEVMLQGLRVFPASYKGEICTVTTLARAINTSVAQLEETADFVSSLKPRFSYLTTHPEVTAPTSAVERALAIFQERVRHAAQAEPMGEAVGVLHLTSPVRAVRRVRTSEALVTATA